MTLKATAPPTLMTERWHRNAHGEVIVGHATQPRLQPPKVSYPFPLHRAGGIVWVTLTMPGDLTRREADKIGRYVQALSFPDEVEQ